MKKRYLGQSSPLAASCSGSTRPALQALPRSRANASLCPVMAPGPWLRAQRTAPHLQSPFPLPPEGNIPPIQPTSITGHAHDNRNANHEEDATFEVARRDRPAVGRAYMLRNKLVAPCAPHDLDKLWLAFRVHMALETDPHRPVCLCHRSANRCAHAVEGHLRDVSTVTRAQRGGDAR
jgi:hypothetical protein